MGIYIENMEKPKSCDGCPFCGYDERQSILFCRVDNEDIEQDLRDDCPLIGKDDTEWEWCHDCKEYDQEAHCCHRWTKVIRKTVAELEERYGERRADEHNTERD